MECSLANPEAHELVMVQVVYYASPQNLARWLVGADKIIDLGLRHWLFEMIVKS